MVPKWLQMIKNMFYWSFGIILDPLRPLWDIGKPAMFGHFWPQKDHFGPHCAYDWRMAMAKTASNQLGICLRIMHVRRIPKVSIFMAVTTKIVPEKAQKWPKMARFWPKWRYNGRVMAREVFFYQCLWVTKFCAKFGRSRTPRTARMHNSLTVLRCMWKEPAPLSYICLKVVSKIYLPLLRWTSWLSAGLFTPPSARSTAGSWTGRRTSEQAENLKSFIPSWWCDIVNSGSPTHLHFF